MSFSHLCVSLSSGIRNLLDYLYDIHRISKQPFFKIKNLFLFIGIYLHQSFPKTRLHTTVPIQLQADAERLPYSMFDVQCSMFKKTPPDRKELSRY